MPRALLVRMDKLGDLVLSLSVDEAPELRPFETHWMVSLGTGFIPRHAVPPRRFHEFAKNFSWREFTKVVRWVRALKPDVAIVFYAPWWIGLALWLARVPKRVGRRSQWHSYLFFNRGFRQSRSRADRHESAFNLELVQRLFDLPQGESSLPPPLKLKAPEGTSRNWGLTSAQYIVVHPGMAGSALNWPVTHYAELIRYLAQQKTVVITGTGGDKIILTRLKEILAETPSVKWLDNQVSSEELLVLLEKALAVIAPSTGVLHLAASLGAPAVGIYSPIPVQRPTRWGPRGAKAMALTAPASIEEAQANPDQAMSRLSVPSILGALQELGVKL